MKKLQEVINRAIADYGFRQEALWSPQDVATRFGLSPRELQALEGPLHGELEKLPIPVQPADIPTQQARFAHLISKALGA